MGFVTFGGVIQSERFTFKKHAVVVDQHRAVNEFERAFAVVLEVTNGIEGVGIVAFGLNLEAQFYSLPFGDFVSVRHHLHIEGIGLLHIEVVGAGCE